MPLYEYRCEKCGLLQEKNHKIDEELSEGCENPDCDATKEDLKRQLSVTPKHVSWTKWRV